MHMLYNSESFAVVAFDIPSPAPESAASAGGREVDTGPRGGFEIVDKFARKDIFLEGAVAESFKAGVEELMKSKPSEEDIDAYIGRYTATGTQPLVLH